MTELRKTKLIESIKDKANEIIEKKGENASKFRGMEWSLRAFRKG